MGFLPYFLPVRAGAGGNLAHTKAPNLEIKG
jgi:hypothetical protein